MKKLKKIHIICTHFFVWASILGAIFVYLIGIDEIFNLDLFPRQIERAIKALIFTGGFITIIALCISICLSLFFISKD